MQNIYTKMNTKNTQDDKKSRWWRWPYFTKSWWGKMQ